MHGRLPWPAPDELDPAWIADADWLAVARSWAAILVAMNAVFQILAFAFLALQPTLPDPEIFILLLSVLQREGRLVDFLMEDLGTYSVCVSPSMLPVETTVKVATVCGFPPGSTPRRSRPSSSTASSFPSYEIMLSSKQRRHLLGIALLSLGGFLALALVRREASPGDTVDVEGAPAELVELPFG